MRRGKLHAGLLCAMFLIAIGFLASFGQAGTDWSGGGMPSLSPTPIPPAPGAPAVRVSLPASPDTAAPKFVEPNCGGVAQQEVQYNVQCVQQCVVPVRTVRYYNVVSAAPVMHNVGCAGQAANIGCQRIGLLNRFRARRALFTANARAYAAVGCGG